MKKVALSLSGGGTICTSYIGVLKAFKENNIPINFIIGASAGITSTIPLSFGFSIDEIITFAKKINNKKFISKKSIINFHLWDQQKWIDFIDNTLGKRNLEDATIPSFIQLTKLYDKKTEIFSKGYLSELLVATLAYPRLLPKRKINNNYYYDGYIYGDFGVSFLKSIGADIVIGLEPLNPEFSAIRKKDRLKADLIISNTAIKSIPILFNNVDSQIENGYKIGLKYIKKIKHIINVK